MTSVVNRSLSRVALLLSFILFFLSACSEAPPHHFSLSGFTMGTSYHVTVVDPQQQHPPEQLQADIEQLLEAVNQQMSTYDEHSELSFLNRLPNSLPFEVSPSLFDVLLTAMEVSWLTGGAFDVTVAPLVNAWGFGPGAGEHNIPGQAELDAIAVNVGYQYLVLHIDDNAVEKTRPVTIDLSAIAKGYAVDQLATLLLAYGIADFMVEIGGELRLSGQSPRASPWRIAIENPAQGAAGEVHRALNLGTVAMATSGDYRNYREVDGQRYSHTIDPRTARPITHQLASVTVIADSAAIADALATGINVMGIEQGLKLANSQGLAVYLIARQDDGFVVKYSDAFKLYLQ